MCVRCAGVMDSVRCGASWRSDDALTDRHSSERETGEAAVRSNEGGGRAGEKNAGASQESTAVTCVVV